MLGFKGIAIMGAVIAVLAGGLVLQTKRVEWAKADNAKLEILAKSRGEALEAEVELRKLEAKRHTDEMKRVAADNRAKDAKRETVAKAEKEVVNAPRVQEGCDPAGPGIRSALRSLREAGSAARQDGSAEAGAAGSAVVVPASPGSAGGDGR